tara:strand:- start:5172 stop:5342 length:171 start_codon:yes stop_codon:yes gene_type:complete
MDNDLNTGNVILLFIILISVVGSRAKDSISILFFKKKPEFGLRCYFANGVWNIYLP